MFQSTTIAGIEFAVPLMNAAGTCKHLDGPDGFKELIRSPVGAVTVGSITMEERPGNPGEVYYPEKGFSLNSLGLPNRGIKGYKEILPLMARIASDHNKPFIVSVAPFSPAEAAELVSRAYELGAMLVEVNEGCPNVWVGGEQKPIPCYHPELHEETLTWVAKALDDDPVIIKLSPILDMVLLKKIVEITNKFSAVKAIVSCNTVPNCVALDSDGKSVITPTSGEFGFAGMSGPWMKPMNMGQIPLIRKFAREDIAVIAVGGIECGQDVHDYTRVGATAFGVGKAYVDNGPKIFGEILKDLV